MYYWQQYLSKLFTRNEAGKRQTRIYLDYAAATPVTESVRAAMQSFFTEHYGNPSAIHQEGQAARAAVDAAREQVASLLGIRREGVIFTAGGTESNNLILLSYLKTLHQQGRAYEDMEVLTTAIEHPATTQALAEAATWGVSVRCVPVTETGVCTAQALTACLTPQTVIVSIAHINSETGTIQPTRRLARAIREYARLHHSSPARLHIDAAQSPLWCSCRLDSLGADMLSLDAGKCGGPKGVGVVALVSPDILGQSISYGGAQERGLRPGTEAVPLIVGCAQALDEAQTHHKARSARVAPIRDAVITYVTTRLPGAHINGPQGAQRVANNVNISLPGFDTEFAAITLDTHGYAVSTKSACSSSDSAASSVVYAISQDTARARSTLRFTCPPTINEADFLAAVDVLAEHVAAMHPYQTASPGEN